MSQPEPTHNPPQSPTAAGAVPAEPPLAPGTARLCAPERAVRAFKECASAAAGLAVVLRESLQDPLSAAHRAMAEAALDARQEARPVERR